jgi:galactose-1-phosphate uridylyltransferase
MNYEKHLFFDALIGEKKIKGLLDGEQQCPFCNKECLKEILAQQGPIILVKNKYPVLRDTFQTVLIETENCTSELSRYPKKHLYAVIRFGVEKWFDLIQSDQYKSVIFFKNHGPYSGGTISHPHMQIIGLNKIDYHEHVSEDDFWGETIHKQPGVELNLSTRPRMGFFEFNVILSKKEKIDRMADYIQASVHYLLNRFSKFCNSYNLFFYLMNGDIMVKVIPRFITSPLYIGYSIPQISSRFDQVIEDIRKNYFPKAN